MFLVINNANAYNIEGKTSGILSLSNISYNINGTTYQIPSEGLKYYVLESGKDGWIALYGFNDVMRSEIIMERNDTGGYFGNEQDTIQITIFPQHPNQFGHQGPYLDLKYTGNFAEGLNLIHAKNWTVNPTNNHYIPNDISQLIPPTLKLEDIIGNAETKGFFEKYFTSNLLWANPTNKEAEELMAGLIFVDGRWIPQTQVPNVPIELNPEPETPINPIQEDKYPFVATSTLLFGEEVEADQDFRVWNRDRVITWIWDDWINEYGMEFRPDDNYMYEHLLTDPSTNPPKREDYPTEMEFMYAKELHKLNLIQELETAGILGPVDSLDGFYARAYWSAQKQTIEQWNNTEEKGGFDRFLTYSSYDSPLGKIPTEEYIGEWYTRITYASKNLSPGGSHTFEPTEAETKKLWASVNIMLQEASPQEASGHLAVMHMGYGGFPQNIEYTYKNIDWSRIDIERFQELNLPKLSGETWGEPPTFRNINLSDEQKEILLTKWGFTNPS
jgi:hypothetical protein